jgi:negative regulator of sigma E activity
MRLLPLILVLAPSLHAQTAPASPQALAADAKAHLKKSQMEELNYTFIDTERDHTHLAYRFSSNHTTVSETIALLGTQYTRRLQVDGKPLAGDALKHEQELYEQAIKDRQSVEDVRAKEKGHFQHKSTYPTDLLTNFDIRILGHEPIDGRPCTILRFVPRSGAQPPQSSRVTWWVDDSTHDVLREDRELVATEDKFLPGSVFSTRYAFVDNVMLPRDSTADLNWNEPAIKNRGVHLIATHTFTNYRRFRTTVTISTPPEGAPPPQD